MVILTEIDHKFTTQESSSQPDENVENVHGSIAMATECAEETMPENEPVIDNAFTTQEISSQPDENVDCSIAMVTECIDESPDVEIIEIPIETIWIEDESSHDFQPNISSTENSQSSRSNASNAHSEEIKYCLKPYLNDPENIIHIKSDDSEDEFEDDEMCETPEIPQMCEQPSSKTIKKISPGKSFGSFESISITVRNDHFDKNLDGFLNIKRNCN